MGGSRIAADLTAFTDKLLRNRDGFLTEGCLAVRLDLVSVGVEETVVELDLSLRLKRETKRRIVDKGRRTVQRISRAMGWRERGEDRGTKEGGGGRDSPRSNLE